MAVARLLLVGVIPVLIGGWSSVAILQQMHHRPELSKASTGSDLPSRLAATAPLSLNSKAKIQTTAKTTKPSKTTKPAKTTKLSRPAPIKPKTPDVLSAPSSLPIADLDSSRWDPIDPLDGADGLGGPVTLKSLREPEMPVAARAERLQQKRSGNVLSALPLHWQQRVPELLSAQNPVGEAAWVRFPAPELQTRTEVVMLINDKGEPEALLPLKNEVIRQRVVQWLKARPWPSAGFSDLYVLAFEPIVQ